MDNAFLFHDEMQDGFANMEINGHRETHKLKSKFFKQWIIRQYYEQTGHSPNSEAVRQALELIKAKAIFDGPQYQLHLRVAKHDGAIWYDLANDDWQVVKITPDGWEVVDEPPILFRRYKNTAPQVLPERGGSLALLRKYINFINKSDWLLSDAYDAVSLMPGVPHTVSIFYGDKGSAKTTAQRVKRKIIDPAYQDTLLLPNDKSELALMLMTNYAPIFDNLDGLQPWQSDMLCQAATGGGISKRELYTDVDEVILSFMRCLMLNGINLVASRDDLLDRSLLFKLDRIDEESRMEEAEFWQEFEKDRPFILGALFDAVSAAMRMYHYVTLDSLPRMADFARYGYAVNEAISGNGEAFLEAYYRNIAGAVEEAVLSEQVSAAIVEFMSDRQEWESTATELLEMLNEIPGIDTKAKSWPKKPHTLTRRINKMKAVLADFGIKVEMWREGTRRVVSLKVKNKASVASHASQSRENEASGNDANSKVAQSVTQASQYEALQNRHPDGSDAIDAIFYAPEEDYSACIDDDLRKQEKERH